MTEEFIGGKYSHPEQGSYTSGKLNFFQGQGIVREFYDLRGKMKFCQNVREF